MTEGLVVPVEATQKHSNSRMRSGSPFGETEYQILLFFQRIGS